MFDVRALKLIWPWARPYRRYAIGAVLASAVGVLINLSIPLLTSRIIDDGIAVGNQGLVTSLAVTMIVLILIAITASALSSVLAVRIAFHTTTDLRRDLYAHTQKLSFANLDRLSTGEILTRLTSDMTKVTQLLGMTFSFFTQVLVMFVGALSAIVLIDASLVVIVAVMIPVIGVLVAFVVSQSNVLYDAVQRRIDRLNTVLQENIHGAEVIKAFVRQDHERERFDDVTDDLAGQAVKVNQLVASLFPTLLLISGLGVAAVLWLGGIKVIDGDLTEGQLVAFISYMTMVSMPMMMFAFLQPTISAATASMARIHEVLDEVPAVSDADAGIDLSTQARPGDISFRNVSFAYEATDAHSEPEAALLNVTFDLAQGSTVAVLGATGSGKSTLAHLIPRFYDVTGGSLFIGGVDVRELSKDSLRQSIGIALQQPQLFSGTVIENLRYARPEATLEDIVAAAQAAQAHDFIVNMTEGYESRVEQNGANLSGGQRQRIAIARTLVANPQILILDDSTSAVDLETEARIQQALSEFDNQTVVIVAQRISTALGADEIIVLDEGRLVAHGTHANLVQSSEIYRDIFRSQLGEPVQ